MAQSTPILIFQTGSVTPTGTIVANDTTLATIACAGLRVGDLTKVIPTTDLSAGNEASFFDLPVTAVDVARITISNPTAGTITLDAQVFRVVVLNRYRNTPEFPETIV